MIDWSGDVAVIGAGFGGSLTALLLQRIGLQPVLLDRGAHPRFMIGESSTPLASLALEALAARYDLPRLAPLANYASWKAAYPQLGVGLKRGFSYFQHVAGEPFAPRADHSNELLVAASHSAADADTHWVRADFDHFLVQEAVAAGIPYFDRTQLDALTADGQGWRLRGQRCGEEVRLAATFVIDATGEAGFVARQLGLKSDNSSLRTHSRAIFAHFTGLERWERLYRAAGGRADDHPYPCDDAALHHVFDGGWMWILPFDHGVTSAGFSVDPRLFPLDESVAPADEWRRWLERFPSIAAQFRDAEIVSDGGRLRRGGRLQRRIRPCAGPNWALLPNAAGFIDAFFSTGNAHTLLGIERLIAALERHWGRPALADALAEYDALFQAEIEFIDGVVAGCYAGFRDFPAMAAMSLFYFATAIWAEHRRRDGRDVPRAFLCADEPPRRAALAECLGELLSSRTSSAALAERVRRLIEPINLAHLGDPARQNLYPYPPPATIL